MTSYQLEARRELIQNRRPAEIPLPEYKFEAHQIDAGTVLLFSIGSGGVLFVTQEVPGIAPGWQCIDLSSAAIERDVPGGMCSNFASALSLPVAGQPDALHLAMVVNDGSNDHLYLSLSNPASGGAWAAGLAWAPCPFNGGTQPSRLAIAGVKISEASDGQFIVVDIVANPDAAKPLLQRYYIDTSQSRAARWVEHKVPIDIEAGIYASCLGRSRDSAGVDGVYLASKMDGAAQLIYSPLYNTFNPALPRLSRRLQLPGELVADTIATCRNPDNTTDLYATANGALYFFAAANQTDRAEALQVGADPLWKGIRKLSPSAAGGRVTVWGLNQADQVIYTSVDRAQAANPAAWSRPIVVLAQVDAIAPYLGRDYSANTFFAHTADGLVNVVKSSVTTLWTSHHIAAIPIDQCGGAHSATPTAARTSTFGQHHTVTTLQ